MYSQPNKALHAQLLLLITATLLNALPSTTLALPIARDSQIQKIIVPYQPNIVSGHPYQYAKLLSETRQVFVPLIMEMRSRFNLNQNAALAGDSANGEILKFADGAYPVYYMPSSVNGKFNGKISLLERVLAEQQQLGVKEGNGRRF